MRRLSVVSSACLMTVMGLLTACSNTSQAQSNTLVALRVGQVSLDAADAIWKKAPSLEVSTNGVKTENAAPGPVLTIQAVYDASQIAFRVEWLDPTESIYKNAWTWDGSAFSRSGDEDRLMFHFPMSNDPKFSSKGCAAICHNQDEDVERWYMAAESPDFRYDQWHWKSSRTNPVGQADDKWLGVRADPADTESGHYADAIDGGGEVRNENDRRNGPIYVNGIDLKSAYIYAGQEAPVDASLLTSGMMIPGYILSPMQGSRGDISAKGVWTEGRWVVVMVRALNTGHDEDVLFTPPKPLAFGIAAADDGGGYNHLVYSDVLSLTWK